MKHSGFFARALVGLFIYASFGLTAAHARISAPIETCHVASTHQIESLFDDWNNALQTRDARKVVALYAESSALLPTLSAKPRFSRAEKLDYFEQFLLLEPVGSIDFAWVKVGCNSAVNTGLYTFSVKDGRKIKARYTFTYEYENDHWEITTHHSSLMPQ